MCALALAALALPVKLVTPAEAKTPGSTYCFYGKCHRVKTIAETQALVGVEEVIYASHYDDCARDRYNPCGLTSSGEQFHSDRPDNTASPIYPDGTTLLVWSPDNERALVVRVNNAGPYWGNRKLDLSRAAAEKLGFEHSGVAKVHVRVVKAPEPQEARYVHNRVYPPVPGDIGQYASLEAAQTGMAVALALQASAASPLAPVTTANAFATGTVPEQLVAEAPQALGRGSRVASVSYRSTVAAPTFGTLLTHSLRLSHAQSQRRVAALGSRNQSVWGDDLFKQSGATIVVPDKPQPEVVAASESEPAKERTPERKDEAKVAAVPPKPQPEPVEVAKVEPKAEPLVVAKAEIETEAKPEAKSEAKSEEKAEAEPAKKSRSKKASRGDEETDVAEASHQHKKKVAKAKRRDKETDVAEVSRSRKSMQARNESRSRATRTAGWSKRADRTEVAYARKAKRVEPGRSTEQITSLGIRARQS
jgi:rare lipoprotein A